MKKAIEFLSELKDNNNKPWFDANKSRYLEVQEEFAAFVEKLIEGIEKFDSEIKGLKPKDCMYRIYRDVRFSPNKEPYKNWMGAYICKGGKKSEYAGYYFYIEPRGADYIGGSILSVGSYAPQPKILKSIREEILDNGAGFEAAIKKAKGFSLLHDGDKLRKVPKGFPPDSEWSEYLKLKDFSLSRFITDKELFSDGLLDLALDGFKSCKDFNGIINRAVDYALAEM